MPPRRGLLSPFDAPWMAFNRRLFLYPPSCFTKVRISSSSRSQSTTMNSASDSSCNAFDRDLMVMPRVLPAHRFRVIGTIPTDVMVD
jgi:hypothetical protein